MKILLQISQKYCEKCAVLKQNMDEEETAHRKCSLDLGLIYSRSHEENSVLEF